MSLPTKQPAHDPYEKPDRYDFDHRNQPILGRMKDAWMAQSQRMRYAKIGAAFFLILCGFLWFSPSSVSIHPGGKTLSLPPRIAFVANSLAKTRPQRRPSSCRLLLRNRPVHQVVFRRQAHRSVCSNDRRWKHRLPNPRLQVQQLRCHSPSRRRGVQDDGEVRWRS